MANEAFVSIVMPVRNEASFIVRSLGAVLDQEYPPEAMEIIIVDGESDDDTLAIIATLPDAERVRIISNPQRLQAAGMNAAIAAARGVIIIRVDGHTIIAPDYVRRCVEALAATGAVNVGGLMHPVGTSAMGRAIAAAARSRFAVPSAFHVSDHPQMTDTVYMGAWPRAALQRVDGFDAQLRANEDYELNVRLRAAGGTIYLDPQIRSAYYGRQTLGALWHQYWHYGRGKTDTLRKHPGSLRPRQMVAPLFVVALVGGGVLALVNAPLRWLWLLLLVVYGGINGLVSLQLARKAHDVMLALRAPLVFATIHMSWGMGFWMGICKGEATRPKTQTTASIVVSEDASLRSVGNDSHA